MAINKKKKQIIGRTNEAKQVPNKGFIQKWNSIPETGGVRYDMREDIIRYCKISGIEFQAWLDQKTPIPPEYIPEMAHIIGCNEWELEY